MSTDIVDFSICNKKGNFLLFCGFDLLDLFLIPLLSYLSVVRAPAEIACVGLQSAHPGVQTLTGTLIPLWFIQIITQ